MTRRWWTKRRHRAQGRRMARLTAERHVCPNVEIRVRLANLPPGQNVVLQVTTNVLSSFIVPMAHCGATEWVELLTTTDGLILEARR